MWHCGVFKNNVNTYFFATVRPCERSRKSDVSLLQKFRPCDVSKVMNIVTFIMSINDKTSEAVASINDKTMLMLKNIVTFIIKYEATIKSSCWNVTLRRFQNNVKTYFFASVRPCERSKKSDVSLLQKFRPCDVSKNMNIVTLIMFAAKQYRQFVIKQAKQ